MNKKQEVNQEAGVPVNPTGSSATDSSITPAAPAVDENEGLGGSYVRKKDGARVLVSRTVPRCP